MRWLIGVLAAMSLAALSAPMAQAEYYYSSGNQIPLIVDTLRMVVEFDGGPTQSTIDSLLGSFSRIVGESNDPLAADNFLAFTLAPAGGYYAFLDSIHAVDGVNAVEPYYLIDDSAEFVICGQFCVAFDSSVTSTQIDSINSLYHVEILHEMLGMQNVFLLKNTGQSDYNTLELANIYYGLTETRYSHPDFRSYLSLAGYKLYDYYNEYQPQIKKVIGTFNEATVWDFAEVDRPIKVAVVDDGIIWHEDLPIERLLWIEGWNFCDNYGNFLPNDSDYHAMACAGILAASHTTDSLDGLQTTSGVISMNPHILVLPVKIYCDLSYNVPDRFEAWCSMIATAINTTWMGGTEVLSCSWGWPRPSYDSDVLNEAISNAYNLGRNGRGCPVIFAAGNERERGFHVQYPARLPTVLAVGATNLNDSAYEWSQNGPNLDIMAPSASNTDLDQVWSIDQEGQKGFNPTYYDECPPGANNWAYQCRFNGTSAACPIVAGAASLLLARDSTLTAGEVYNILDSSAVTELDWGITITPPDTLYGYGRVDAFRAMLAITRGDANNDGRVDIGDIAYLVNHIYRSGPPPTPDPLTGDANCDGEVTAGDPQFLINYVFKDGPAPTRCYEY